MTVKPAIARVVGNNNIHFKLAYNHPLTITIPQMLAILRNNGINEYTIYNKYYNNETAKIVRYVRFVCLRGLLGVVASYIQRN